MVIVTIILESITFQQNCGLYRVITLTTYTVIYIVFCFTGIINFNGPDANFTMSNTDNTLYLRARPKRKDVVARPQPNVSWLAIATY